MTPNRRHVSLMLAGGFAAAGSSHAALAQPAAPPQSPEPDDDSPGQVALARDDSLRMLAPVMINGEGPFQFLVDTGANRSCVNHDLAERLALPAGPQAAVTTIVGRSLRPTVVVDRLHVGSKVQRRVKVPALRLASEEGADGILGVDWLKGRKLVLDFKGHLLEITQPRAERNTSKRVVVPASRRSGQLTLVDADVDGRNISAMIDSGSELTLGNAALRRLVAASNRPLAMPPQRVAMRTVIGERFHGDLLYVPFMRLGGLTLGNVPVVFSESHVFDLWGLKTKPAVVLGMDLLSEFTAVALDFGLSTVRFDIA